MSNEDTAKTASQTEGKYEETKEMKKNGKKKGKRKWFIAIPVILVIVLLASACAYYFYERQQATNAVKQYLTHVQNMDFEGMSHMLQSNDLTELDENILTAPEFQDFFQNLNSKMTFKIRNVSMNLQEGTANVTARISYVNATEIYKEAISECLRKIAVSALNGSTDATQEDLLKTPIESQLAPILKERAASMDTQFAETDITYPVVKTSDGWKIASLDSETASIMSADFDNVKQEIENSLVDITPTQEGENSVDTANNIISLDNENFTVKYTTVRISKDLAEEPCLEFYYDYTNKRNEPSCPMKDLALSAMQDGQNLLAALPGTANEAYDNYMKDIAPGETVNVCQIFSLTSTTDVTITASDPYEIDNTVSKQVIKVQ